MTVHLDLREHIDTIVRAVQDKTLQCYITDMQEGCYYSGPCAIGICIPSELWGEWDNVGSFCSILVDRNNLATVPEEQKEDWIRLQNLHDSATGFLHTTRFEDFVYELQKKYGNGS